MRLLEGMMFLLCILLVVSIIIKKYRRRKITKYLSILLFITFTGHIIYEGTRWQLYLLYLIIIVAVILTILSSMKIIDLKKYNKLNLILKILSIIFLVLTAISAYAFPVYNMPKPTGKYEIGTISFDILDNSRKEIYSKDKEDYRKIRLQLWYPAENGGNNKVVPWLQDGIMVSKGASRIMGLPDFLFSHTALIKSNSYSDAPINKSKEKYPVVIISHGWTGFRDLHTDVAELLASQGYIVAGINHTYGSAVTVFDDGEVIYLNKNALPSRDEVQDFLKYANNLVNTYAGDIELTLRELKKLNNGEEDSKFKSRLDFEKLGLLGHSTGGGASVTTALRNENIKAVMGLDPWVEPIEEEEIKKGLSLPALFLRSEQWEESLNNKNLFMLIENSKSPLQLYQINGINHLDFTMSYMYSPLSKYFNITGELDGWKGAEIQQDFILKFFDKYLKGIEDIRIKDISNKYDASEEIYIK